MRETESNYGCTATWYDASIDATFFCTRETHGDPHHVATLLGGHVVQEWDEEIAPSSN
jgi:hypothetical protein